MTRTVRIGLITAMIALVSGAGWTLAGRGPGRGQGNRPDRLERAAVALDLSADQVGRIREIVTRHFAGGLGEAVAQLHQSRLALHRLISSPDASVEQIQNAVREQAALQERAALEKFALAREIRGVLSPEQQAKAQEWIDRLDSFRGFRPGRGGRGSRPTF